MTFKKVDHSQSQLMSFIIRLAVVCLLVFIVSAAVSYIMRPTKVVDGDENSDELSPQQPQTPEASEVEPKVEPMPVEAAAKETSE